MVNETKEDPMVTMAKSFDALTKFMTQAATRRSRQKKLLGSFANNFFVFQFCVMKFGDNTKSTMGYNPVTLFFRKKKFFFWKILVDFHIRGDPYLQKLKKIT